MLHPIGLQAYRQRAGSNRERIRLFAPSCPDARGVRLTHRAGRKVMWLRVDRPPGIVQREDCRRRDTGYGGADVEVAFQVICRQTR